MKVIQQSAMLECCPTRDDALSAIERAGRTCYKSECVGDPAKFVKSILNKNHESVIEHCSATFRFITDRGVSHEIVRHRIASFSQSSTRYCNFAKDKFGKELTFIEPVNWCDMNEERRNLWLAHMLQTELDYMRDIELGATPQEARGMLPNALSTEIVMTANFREWRTVFNLRTSKAAHPQMRALMLDAQRQMAERIPELFATPQP